MAKDLKLDYGYYGEIKVGEPSYTNVTRNGFTKHIPDYYHSGDIIKLKGETK